MLEALVVATATTGLFALAKGIRGSERFDVAPDPGAVADMARDIFRIIRDRDIPGFGNRGFFGGGGPRDVEPGAYTVALTVEGRTWTQPLTVLRAPTFRPAETVDPEDVRLFLKALRR